jgi:hypothetical protein
MASRKRRVSCIDFFEYLLFNLLTFFVSLSMEFRLKIIVLFMEKRVWTSRIFNALCPHAFLVRLAGFDTIYISTVALTQSKVFDTI